MKIRIRAKAKKNPCIFCNSCHGASDWCKTHRYTEACMGMVMHQAEALLQNWLAARKEIARLEKENSRKYWLKDIARAICDSYDKNNCDECPAREHCSAGHNGMLEWLEKVIAGECD